MAITYSGSKIHYPIADVGTVIQTKLRVLAINCVTGGTAGTFVIKDRNGNTVEKVEVTGINDSKSVSYGGRGVDFKGLEFDAGPASSELIISVA